MQNRFTRSPGPAGVVVVVLLCLVAPVISGCADGSGPGSEPPTKPKLEITGGTFELQTSIIFDNCNTPMQFDGEYALEISGSQFSMGASWTGTWDAKTLTGRAESDRTRTTLRSCTVTTWTTVEITFTSENEFHGQITYRKRTTGTCNNTTPCLMSFGISGVRM